jgi:hypothetical protein
VPGNALEPGKRESNLTGLMHPLTPGVVRIVPINPDRRDGPHQECFGIVALRLPRVVALHRHGGRVVPDGDRQRTATSCPRAARRGDDATWRVGNAGRVIAALRRRSSFGGGRNVSLRATKLAKLANDNFRRRTVSTLRSPRAGR